MAIGALGGALIGGGISALGNYFSGREQADAVRDNAAMQREFAQHGIRWRVEDAKAAGIHPLYALGANVSQASPVSVGDYGVGRSISDMGQNISRAMAATATSEERALAKIRLAGAQADLDGKLIDNQIRGSQLQGIQSVGPSFPGVDNFDFSGQPNASALVTRKPLRSTVSQPGRRAQEAGWRPDVSYARTDTGLTPVIPESLSESMEDDLLGKVFWHFRNRLMPTAGAFVGKNYGSPPASQLPSGADGWKWNSFMGEWQPTYDSRNFKHYRKVR